MSEKLGSYKKIKFVHKYQTAGYFLFSDRTTIEREV